MKKTLIILVAIAGLLFISGVASAFPGKAGTICPLTLKNYQITTDTAILPDWKPTHVKWSLIDPHGQVRYVVDSQVDSAVQTGGTIIVGSTTWSINENSGTLKIPAFAEPGEWRMNVKFYDRALFIFYNEKGFDAYPILVSESSIIESLNAPVTWVITLPFQDSSFTLAIDVIYIIGMLAIFAFFLLILFTLKTGRKIHA